MADIKAIMENAGEEVRRSVEGCEGSDVIVIARYAAAIAVNFTDWMGKTIPWVRHELAYSALVDNLRCEVAQDHIGMLMRFVWSCGAEPHLEVHRYLYDDLAAIRGLFADPATAGIKGLALMATLEKTSAIFIPDLAERGKKRRCDDFAYIDAHGEADAAHAHALLQALEVESGMGYADPDLFIGKAANVAVRLIRRVYS